MIYIYKFSIIAAIKNCTESSSNDDLNSFRLCMIQKVSIECQDCLCDGIPALCENNQPNFHSDVNVEVYNFGGKVACNNFVLSVILIFCLSRFCDI